MFLSASVFLASLQSLEVRGQAVTSALSYAAGDPLVEVSQDQSPGGDIIDKAGIRQQVGDQVDGEDQVSQTLAMVPSITAGGPIEKQLAQEQGLLQDLPLHE